MSGRFKIQTGYLVFNSEQFQIVHTKKKWYDGQLFTIIFGVAFLISIIERASDNNSHTVQLIGIAVLAAYLILFGFFLWAVFVKRRKPVTDIVWVKDIRKIKIRPTLFGNRVVKIYHQRDDVYGFTAHKVDLDGMNFVGVVKEMDITLE